MPILSSDVRQLEVAHRLRQKLRDAVRGRYPVVLVIADPSDAASEFWEAFAKSESLSCVDLLEQSQDNALALRAAPWPELVAWVRRRALETRGAIILQLDVFATQWRGADRERLFRKLLKSELRDKEGNGVPLVVVSTLAGYCDLSIGAEGRDCGLLVDLREWCHKTEPANCEDA